MRTSSVQRAAVGGAAGAAQAGAAQAGTAQVGAGQAGVEPDPEHRLEQHRKELTGYCYRMLGSVHDAEDAVQEAMLRAWRGLDRFDGRSSLRSWLYRITTNVCLDSLTGKAKRATPMDLGGPSAPVPSALGEPRPSGTWVEPAPDSVLEAGMDPADTVAARDSVRLAFIAALQHLPARQRAVLILRDVLRWRSGEVAELLDTSIASVNSALQRARATMAGRDLGSVQLDPVDGRQRLLLDRYLDAFQRYDMNALVALLHEDASQSMPPYELWLRGRGSMITWMFGPGAGCRGSRLIPVLANGCPAFGQYRPSGDGGAHEPWALQVVEIVAGQIAHITFFLDAERLFPVFDLAPHLATRDA